MYRFIDETIDETIDEPISDKAAQSHVKTVTIAPPTPLPTHGAHPSPQPPLVLPLVETLCRRLAEKAIRYCHWKSNDMLARSASGDNDLDLLVSRQDAERFTTLLHELGFKAAREIHPWQIPGILDYYGYDSESGRLVHAHVHYQLIVGEDTTKNYHLPLEEPYLATATQGALFKTPAPEFEFILFVIRMILKHGTWDTMLGGWGTLATGERRELHYLEQQVATSSLIALLNTHLPTVDYLFFTQCVAALAPDCPVWKRIAVGYQLQRRLRAHARRGHLRDVGLRFWRRGQLAYRRRFAQLPKRQLCRGGALIAIIGGDGSGKTTAVAKTYQWLSADFDTTKVHLGKPPWSRTTNTIRALLKVARRLTGTPYIEWAAVLYEGEKAVRGFA
ncbi:MAG: hypothetical protein KDE47_24990, partial [Caldilineaceae bacterium]|nr:hypothetical protein [Caldilineaceae bacterium]